MESENHTMAAHYIYRYQAHQIAYQRAGTPGARPMLLVHGMGGNTASWNLLRRCLQSHFDLYLFDLPGHGHSQAQPDELSIEWYTRIIAGFVTEMELEAPIGVGHSMGGQILLGAHLWQQVAFGGFALLAPAGIEAFTPSEANTMLQGLEWLAQQNSESLQQWMDQPHNSDGPDNPNGNQQQILAQCVRSMLREPVHDRLKQVNVPSLLIFGQKDNLIPNRLLHWQLSVRELAMQQGGKIPGASLRVLKDAGHFLHRTHPKTVVAQMQEQSWWPKRQ